jgi:hypothetical protein
MAERSLRAVLVVLAALLPAPLHGQEPPSHFPACSTDSAARAFLGRVRYLLSANDSAGRVRLERLGLAGRTAADAALVTEEPVCLDAASAYAGLAHRANGLRAPFPVMVVRAGDRLLVQLGGVFGREAAAWEVFVFDPAFHALGSY